MDEASLKPVIEKLEILFSKLNERFFDAKLEKPVITVSPDIANGAYGWCTSWKAWQDGSENDGYYEINLCAEYLNRTLEDICETMLHEMVHLCNLCDGVKDTSRRGTYHNKRFKLVAEAHGLNVEKTEKYGYAKTSLNPEALSFVTAMGDEGFALVRSKIPKPGKKKVGNSRKFVCPICGTVIRATTTKEIHITCTDCGAQFEEET